MVSWGSRMARVWIPPSGQRKGDRWSFTFNTMEGQVRSSAGQALWKGLSVSSGQSHGTVCANLNLRLAFPR